MDIGEIKMPYALGFILIIKRNLLMCLFGQATRWLFSCCLYILLLEQCLLHLCPNHRTLQFLITGLSQYLPACLPLPWARVSLVTDEPSFPRFREDCCWFRLQSAVCSGVSPSEFAPDLWDALINHPCLCHGLWALSLSLTSEQVQAQACRVQPNSAWWKFPMSSFYSSNMRHWFIMSLHRLRDGP